MTNFSKKPGVLHKHICTALGTDPPDCIVECEQNEGLKSTVEINNVHYKKLEDWQTEIEGKMKVDHEYAEWKAHEWTQAISTDIKFDVYRDKSIGKMDEFESMCICHLGCLIVAKHGIELKSDVIQAVHCATYIAKPRTREFE